MSLNQLSPSSLRGNYYRILFPKTSASISARIMSPSTLFYQMTKVRSHCRLKMCISQELTVFQRMTVGAQLFTYRTFPKLLLLLVCKYTTSTSSNTIMATSECVLLQNRSIRSHPCQTLRAPRPTNHKAMPIRHRFLPHLLHWVWPYFISPPCSIFSTRR